METLLADYTMKDQILSFCKQRKTLAREVWLWKELTIKDEHNGASVCLCLCFLIIIDHHIYNVTKKIELNF